MPIRLAVAVLLLCPLLFLRTPALAEPLPTDPALVTGELENRLRYVVKRHANPPGRAMVWVHFHTGSLNETDRQRGIAHFLEHMAFNGSENFKPGTLVPFFQSLGMTFGRDQNAFTSMNQTVYQLSLPNAKSDTLGQGLTFFADIIARLSLLPEEIQSERQIILEERRRGLGGRQRTNDYVLQRLVPGSRFGFRSPIGTEETIKAFTQQDFRDYYRQWYGAANATLIVVADADEQGVVSVIQAKMGDLPKRPRPEKPDLNVRPYEKSFGIVASDPEVRGADVRIVRIGPAKGPTTTVERYREELGLGIAEAAMNRRLRDGADRGGGQGPYLSGRVTSGDQAGAVHSTELSARAKPEQWQAALEAVALELQRARVHGFSDEEVDRVKQELLSNAERAVEVEDTTPASSMMNRINGRLAADEPILSPQQRLDLLKRLLPEITPPLASSLFAAEFDFDLAAFVVVMPSNATLPAESELVDVGTRALAAKPGPKETRQADKVDQLVAVPPAPGTVTEGAEHAATQVWSGWLSNNVRVHYRFMDQQKDQASVRVSLLGGELLETADNRGITSAAQLAWTRPATARLSSQAVRDYMTGRKVSVRAGSGGGPIGGRGRRAGSAAGASPDAISLSISGRPDELETGFQLAYLLLTEPKIEESAFTQFQVNTRESLQEAFRSPMAVGQRTSAMAPYPDDDPRFQPLTVEQVDALSLPAAQAWLEKLLKDSPIEVSIIGDLSREKALDLACRYLGALPARERVAAGMFAERRTLKRPPGPRVFERQVESPTQQAYVLCGFYGADETNRPDVRALNMAARVLSTRMTREVREQAQLVYSIGAGSRAAGTFPGFGVFSAAAPTDPGKADALVEKLTSMYDAFASEGPTDAEIEVARKQFANTFAEQLKEPSFWATRLDRFDFRGLSLDDLASEPDAYQHLTAQQVRETFARYYSRDAAIRVVVKPKAPGPATQTAGGGQ